MAQVTHSVGLVFLTLLAAVLLLVGVGRGDGVPSVRQAAGGFEQDLVRWEISHFMDKWLRQAVNIALRRSASASERETAIAEFFDSSGGVRESQEALARALAAEGGELPRAQDAQRELAKLESRRAELAPVVEEAIEAAVTDVLSRAGIIDHAGPIRWPPVDFTFTDSALVLVRSPRDEVRRLADLLLEPNVALLERAAIEERVEAEDDVSALVVRVGGIATYPTQVQPLASLHRTLELVIHEWLHHWLIFRPLGRAWFAGGELQNVNETLANMVGEEIGDLALTELTGEVFERRPWTPPEPPSEATSNPGVFDYAREMRRTRTRLDALLADGTVADAEAYLEERRLAFGAAGYPIRKLNTAWFAFHGTYADDPASVSPIEAQLRAVRADSGSLAEFVDRVAVIDAEGDLEQIAREAGWEASG
jgi:hypothetical protein